MTSKFGLRVLLAFAATILIVAALGLFSYDSTQRLITAEGQFTHSLNVASHADIALKSIVDMETGERGFIITGEDDFLEPFNESALRISGHLAKLDSLTAADPIQHLRCDTLEQLFARQLTHTKSVIETRRQSFEKSKEMILKREGKIRMDSIRSVVKRINDDEAKNFQKRNDITSASLRRFQLSFVGLCASVLIVISILFVVNGNALKARHKSEEEIKLLNQELEAKVAARTRELIESQRIYRSIATNIPGSAVLIFDRDHRYVFAEGDLLLQLGYQKEKLLHLRISELVSGEVLNQYNALLDAAFRGQSATREVRTQSGRYTLMRVAPLRRDDDEIFGALMLMIDINEVRTAQQKVDDLNKNLESMVEKRTEQLDRVNKELESFTYSVSHDLRAPLRSITGYSQILKENESHNLNEESQHALSVVMRNALRMGNLIDDLLEFSRMGRKSLANAPLDMNALFQSVLEEVSAQYEERKIKIIKNNLLPATGDNSMIHQVWTNLTSNAFKYTGKKENPEVEVGSYYEDGFNIYYVRDNGAGFDMQYAAKLFGVFQRLHKMNEFEGTGVGLALTKTIISRHNGKVWADATLGQGATFFFSLPVTNP